MGESILYYSVVGLLGLLILVCGAWINSLLPGDCSDKGLWSSVRFLIVSGAVILTVAIGIFLCNIKCEGHGVMINPYMMLMLGLFMIVEFAFFMITIGKVQKAKDSQGNKCISEEKSKSIHTWLWIVGFAVLFVGLVSIGFSIYRFRKGRNNDEEREASLEIWRRKYSHASEKRRKEERRISQEKEIASLKKRTKEDSKKAKKLKKQSGNSKAIKLASDSRDRSWDKSWGSSRRRRSRSDSISSVSDLLDDYDESDYFDFD